MSELPHIPLIDLGSRPPAALVGEARTRLDDIMRLSLGHYGRLALRQGDRASRRWLKRNGNPYLGEIADIARHVAMPGAYLLNMSYEWTCTSGVGPDPEGETTARLLRTLDWPLDGLGRNVVVARVEAPAGAYYNVTWPGFVGVLTAMAPGRFAVSINQPPMRRHMGACWFDWLVNRVGVWRKSGLPPTHLLRRVFDRCETYVEASAMLAETPLCMPAFYTLSGIGPEEGCVIERTETEASVTPAPAAIANHWLALNEAGMARGIDSEGRLANMRSLLRQGTHGADFAWVRPPILNATTRLSVYANATRGKLSVIGWEDGEQATAQFAL